MIQCPSHSPVIVANGRSIPSQIGLKPLKNVSISSGEGHRTHTHWCLAGLARPDSAKKEFQMSAESTIQEVGMGG